MKSFEQTEDFIRTAGNMLLSNIMYSTQSRKKGLECLDKAVSMYIESLARFKNNNQAYFIIKNKISHFYHIPMPDKSEKYTLTEEEIQTLLSSAKIYMKKEKRVRKIKSAVAVGIIFILVIVVLVIQKYKFLTSEDYMNGVYELSAKQIGFERYNPDDDTLAFNIVNGSEFKILYCQNIRVENSEGKTLNLSYNEKQKPNVILSENSDIVEFVNLSQDAADGEQCKATLTYCFENQNDKIRSVSISIKL